MMKGWKSKCLLTLFCSLFFLVALEAKGRSPKLKLEDEAVSAIIDKKREEGLFVIASGGSEKDKRCATVDLTFRTRQVLNIETGRRLLIETVNELLSSINNKKGIEKRLSEYPFTVRNLKITLIGDSPPDTSDNHIVCAFTVPTRDEIYFFTENHNRVGWREIHSETFDKAKEIVNGETEAAKPFYPNLGNIVIRLVESPSIDTDDILYAPDTAAIIIAEGKNFLKRHEAR